jgi:anti-sigma regulatory factor (Ser/Thr protein kinase)
MPAPDSDLLRLQVPCDRQAPAVVRGALHDRFREHARVVGDAILVASELVANAVLHSGCSEEESIQVRVSLGRDRLLIRVRDPGASGREARARDYSPFGGWGLQIVEQLTDRWGSERGDGHLVWAEMAWPA